MKQIALIAALILPVAATATQAPVELIEAEAKAEFIQVAVAPTLPFAPAHEATACLMSVDPLPDVITLAGVATGSDYLSFCFKN